MTSSRLLVFEGNSVFSDHATSWNDLLKRSDSPSFFLRSDWLDLWARHWGQDHRLFLVVCEEDGQWIGGAPLALGRGRVGGRWPVRKLEFAGMPWFDRMEIPAISAAACKQTLQAILYWAKTDLCAWTAFALQEVPNGSDTLHALQTLSKEQVFPLHSVLASEAPMVDLLSGGNTSSKYRRQLRQSMEQLQELGQVDVDFCVVPAARVEEWMIECAEVEAASWKGKDEVGVFRDSSHRAFMAEIWTALAPEKGVALCTIRLDGRLLIYHWGFRHLNRFLSYNLAQRPETNALRGGSLALKHMVQHGSDLGFTAIDASRGSLTSPNIIGRYHGPVRCHANAVLYGPNAAGSALATLRGSWIPAGRRLLGKAARRKLPPCDTVPDLPCTDASV